MGAPESDVQRLSDIVYIRGGIGSGETQFDNILQDLWSCSLIPKFQELNFQCRSVTFTSALPLCSQCISILIANVILVHGGLKVGGKLSSETKLLFLADLRIESVLQSSHIVPAARSGAVMVHFTHLNAKKIIFLHGGADSVGALMSDTWLYDIASSRYDQCHFTSFTFAAHVFHYLTPLSNVRWSQLNTTANSFFPPARSHACSVLLNHLVIVHGGKCSSDTPWMFNTVSNQWSPLLSAKTQHLGEIPSPRWGHGCLLLPTPGMQSSLATSMYLFGGISTESVSVSEF
jgi:hypothetical protein